MTDLLHPAPTGAETVGTPPALQVSQTRTIDDLAREAHDLTDEAGHLRNITALRAHDISDVHHRAFKVQLATRTTQVARRSPTALLEEINDLGFGWGDIAKMIGVSVPALRRWRQGESATGEHRRRIAELAAFAQILGEDHLVADVASWMEMPITGDVPLTAIDLYVQGHLLTIFDLASAHVTPDQALDSVEAGWRENYRSDFEVYRAGDGQPAIRLRADSDR